MIYGQRIVFDRIIRDRVLAIVAPLFDVTPAAILQSRRGTTDITEARHLSMYLMREVFGLNLARIGNTFDRDHSTVIHALKKVQDLRETDLAFRASATHARAAAEALKEELFNSC